MATPGKGFQTKCIEPVAKAWVERHVPPIIEDAAKDFRDNVQMDPGQLQNPFSAEAPGARVLQVAMS
jgi:hypothetical protein